MSEQQFKLAIALPAVVFLLFFLFIVLPASISLNDVQATLAAGFVNPLASGYAIDAIACWLIMAVWIVYERQTLAVRHGWLCCLLGIIPGVAVGFALYLVIRQAQLETTRLKADRGQNQ